MKQKIIRILGQDSGIEEKLQQICDLLKDQVPHFDWVGFYFSNGERKELKLSSFSGTPTEHTIIPFGKGICGQVAMSNKNFVVQDVNEQNNYISCGFEVKSEIVVPLFYKGNNIGQIDVDSHELAPFDDSDEELLEFICSEIAKLDLDKFIEEFSS